jgi:ubiquinone/menaquinone biosynthesis C-methylase UbiE
MVYSSRAALCAGVCAVILLVIAMQPSASDGPAPRADDDDAPPAPDRADGWVASPSAGGGIAGANASAAAAPLAEAPPAPEAAVNASSPEEVAKRMRVFNSFVARVREKTRGGIKTNDDSDLLQVLSPLRAAPLMPPRGLCPDYRYRAGKDADSRTNSDVVHKYSRYTSQYCNTTGMLQMHFGLAHFVGFLDILASIAGVRPGMHIFDLGSGCGTMLNYLNLKFGTTGVGVDMTIDAVTHSRLHARDGQHFCHLDATMLRYFPSAHFDAVVSWAMLYHVRRTWVQCAILNEVCRILKPGAIAYVGHLRTEKTQAFWKKGRCVATGCTWRRLADAATFRVASFRRHAFFSIYMRRMLPSELASAQPRVDNRANATRDDDD